MKNNIKIDILKKNNFVIVKKPHKKKKNPKKPNTKLKKRK